MKKIMIVCAHPDDEILGMGGTILKHKENKDEIEIIFGTNGREENSLNVKKCMEEVGIKNYHFLNYPDQKIETISEDVISNDILFYLKKMKPDIVYTHFLKDINKDHEKIAKSTLITCRRLGKIYPTELIMFETPSCSERNFLENFKPNYFVDISKFVDKKINALKNYESEIEVFPHPRSVEGIKTYGKFRGLQSNLKYAEAFYIYYKIK